MGHLKWLVTLLFYVRISFLRNLMVRLHVIKYFCLASQNEKTMKKLIKKLTHFFDSYSRCQLFLGFHLKVKDVKVYPVDPTDW